LCNCCNYLKEAKKASKHVGTRHHTAQGKCNRTRASTVAANNNNNNNNRNRARGG